MWWKQGGLVEAGETLYSKDHRLEGNLQEPNLSRVAEREMGSREVSRREEATLTQAEREVAWWVGEEREREATLTHTFSKSNTDDLTRAHRG